MQVGTQNRSSSLYKKAKELIQQGMIGDVHFVRAFWYRNSLPNEPSWRYVIPPEATPQNTDWNRFLGTAPQARLGPAALLPVAALLGLFGRHLHRPAGAPDRHRQLHAGQDRARAPAWPRAASTAGQTTTATCPITFSAIYEYADKLQINYSCYFGNDTYGYGEQVCGNEGTIEVMNRQDLYFSRKPTSAAPARRTGSAGAPGHPPERQGGFQRKRRRHQPFPQLHPVGAGQGKGDRAAAGGPAGRHFRPHGHAVVQEPEEDRLGRRRPTAITSPERRSMAAVAASAPPPDAGLRPAGSSAGVWTCRW